MKTTLAIAAAASAVSAMTFDADLHLFREFKLKHSKVYENDEHEMAKFRAFKENLAIINEHNLNSDVHGFTLGINEFADMTNEEYKDFLLGSGTQPSRDGNATFMAPIGFKAPAEVDWRSQGYVTPVKNQGQCGSCWAFSTVASVEGQYFRKYNGKGIDKVQSFSEQELVDCSTSEGNHGCNGGLMDLGFKWLEKSQRGLAYEDAYQYTARDGTCKEKDLPDSDFPPSDRYAKPTGFTDVKSGDEDALTDAIASVGPISVAIDASHSSFQLYRSGVYKPLLCSSSRLDHGVTAVGYGTENGSDYYIVKNSWGTGWGEKGYIKMARNAKNKCGIATQASYPTL